MSVMEDVFMNNITDLLKIDTKISEVVTWFKVESSGKYFPTTF